MTRELQRAIQAMAVECDDTYAMANSIEDMLEEIFDDHEAQLKAKDEEIEVLHSHLKTIDEDYSALASDFESAVMKIDRLKDTK